MPSALASREKGVALVNIAQIFKKSGMMLTCRKDSGIKSPSDFRGKTLGVWFYGNEYPFLTWMSQLGIPTKGGSNGVNVFFKSSALAMQNCQKNKKKHLVLLRVIKQKMV